MSERIIIISSNEEPRGTLARVILSDGKITIESDYPDLKKELLHGLPYGGKMVTPQDNPEQFFKAILVEYRRGWRSGAHEVMNTENNSWIMPLLKVIFEQHNETLFNWRKQIPTQQGRIKNFENWVLVELVNKLIEDDEVLEVRTNGHFTDKKISVKDVENHLRRELKGSKSSAKHLSADISVKMKKLNPVTGKNFIYNAEIKTGLSPLEIEDDLLIVKYYSEAGVADKAEFAWVVLLPEDNKGHDSSLKTYRNIQKKIKMNYQDFTLLPSQENDSDWLLFCVAILNN